MRFRSLSFLAVILLTAAAGAALGQEAGAVPPPPSVVKPAAELPPIPFAQPPAPVVEPALTENQPAPAVAAPASAAPAPPTAENPAAATGKRAAKSSARKTAAKPLVRVSQSFESVAPAAGVTADASANAPPPVAAPSTAPVQAVAASKPDANVVVLNSRSDVTGTQRTMGVGGWLVVGLGVVLLFGVITVVRRRRSRAERQPSIIDFGNVSSQSSQAVPALAQRR